MPFLPGQPALFRAWLSPASMFLRIRHGAMSLSASLFGRLRPPQVGRGGFEPPSPGSEPGVLPLHHLPLVGLQPDPAPTAPLPLSVVDLPTGFPTRFLRGCCGRTARPALPDRTGNAPCTSAVSHVRVRHLYRRPPISAPGRSGGREGFEPPSPGKQVETRHAARCNIGHISGRRSIALRRAEVPPSVPPTSSPTDGALSPVCPVRPNPLHLGSWPEARLPVRP